MVQTVPSRVVYILFYIDDKFVIEEGNVREGKAHCSFQTTIIDRRLDVNLFTNGI